MDELEKRKIEAEILHIQAQTEKAVTEAAKTDADLESSKKSYGYWIVEITKILGAIVIGGGSFIAMWTGYQASELKKERMEFAAEILDKKIKDAEQLLEASVQKKNELDNAVTTAQNQLGHMQNELEALKSQLVAEKQNIQSASGRETLSEAIKRTNEIQISVSNIDTQLRSAKSEASDIEINVRLRQLVENLFSEVSAIRKAAYDTITKEFRKDPDTVTALLSHVELNMGNHNGVYNTVVTLNNISRAVTQPRKSEINRFCDQADKIGERTKNQCEKLRKWLETSR